MTIEIRQFAATVPANTAIAAKFAVATAFPARTVTQIDWLVPPGPRGEVGWAVAMDGLNVLPTVAGTWIITDNQSGSWVVEKLPDSGNYEILMYNTGQFAHTLYFTFHLDVVVPAGGGASPPPVPAGGGTGTGTGTGTGNGTGTGDQGGTPPPPPPPEVPPPLIVPPSTGTLPVLLPPVLPLPPGQAPTPVPEGLDALLIGIADLSQVWLLEGDSYQQLQSQDEVDALSTAGVPAAGVSQGMHQALYGASRPELAIDLGQDVLSGLLALTRQ